MRVIATIEGCDIVEHDDGTVRFNGRGRIDSDGWGPSHGDKWHQNDTTLHQKGKALNSCAESYVVTPPQIIQGVVPVVLGCQAYVTYKGKTVPAVVGDVGPRKRLGEISMMLAFNLGINCDPNVGGVDEKPSLKYVFHPGVPAVVYDHKYTLQPYKKSHPKHIYMAKYDRHH